MLLILAALGLQVVPVAVDPLPSPEQLFDVVATGDVPRICAKGLAVCDLVQSGAIGRLRDAYMASASTAEQKAKMIALINENRSSTRPDYNDVAMSYFAWRRIATNSVPTVSNPPGWSPPVTITTRCSSYSGRYHSSVTCTSY